MFSLRGNSSPIASRTQTKPYALLARRAPTSAAFQEIAFQGSRSPPERQRFYRFSRMSQRRYPWALTSPTGPSVSTFFSKHWRYDEIYPKRKECMFLKTRRRFGMVRRFLLGGEPPRTSESEPLGEKRALTAGRAPCGARRCSRSSSCAGGGSRAKRSRARSRIPRSKDCSPRPPSPRLS